MWIVGLGWVLMACEAADDQRLEGVYVNPNGIYDKIVLENGKMILSGAGGAVRHQGHYERQDSVLIGELDGKPFTLRIKSDGSLTGKGDLLGDFYRQTD